MKNKSKNAYRDVVIEDKLDAPIPIWKKGLAILRAESHPLVRLAILVGTVVPIWIIAFISAYVRMKDWVDHVKLFTTIGISYGAVAAFMWIFMSNDDDSIPMHALKFAWSPFLVLHVFASWAIRVIAGAYRYILRGPG